MATTCEATGCDEPVAKVVTSSYGGAMRLCERHAEMAAPVGQIGDEYVSHACPTCAHVHLPARVEEVLS